MNNAQSKVQIQKAIRLIINVNDKLDMLYEQHKAYCIEHNGEGLASGYTLEDL